MLGEGASFPEMNEQRLVMMPSRQVRFLHDTVEKIHCLPWKQHLPNTCSALGPCR